MMTMNPPKKPRKVKSSGAPARGYKWQEMTSGKIPNPTVVPVKKKKIKLAPMRTVSSGVNPSGGVRRVVRNRTKPKSL